MRPAEEGVAAWRLLGAATLALAVACAPTADARQMHAGLDYHRYLAERNETQAELAEWKAAFGDMAQANGWMPPSSNSEERSIDDEEEDHLQRFYMTKQNITAMQALNPRANFSTMSPFSLFTNEEFATYVGKAYRSHNGSSLSSGSASTVSTVSTGRRLRSWHKSSSTRTSTTYSGGSPVSSTSQTTTTSSGTPNSASTGTTTTLGGVASGVNTGVTGYSTSSVTTTTTSGTGGAHSSTTTTTTTSSTPGEESTTTTTTSSSGSAGHAATSGFGNSAIAALWQQMGGYNFGGLSKSDMMPETVKPAGSSASSWISNDADSTTTTTTAPVTVITITTSAPTTAAPTTTPTPTTAAPTTIPTPTTATPTTTSDSTTSASATTVSTTDATSTASDADSVDWTDSNCMSPIQSQGSCGDCWAFSTAAAVETAQCIAGGQTSLTKYSEQQLTSCDSQNYGCSGGAPVYAMEYIQQNGFCTEADYPYTSSEGTAASCVTGCTAVDTGITGYETVDGATDLATAVVQQPVIVAVASGNTAWKQYTGGIISSCDTSELDHAVVVVGYTDSEWKIRNSWGESWGEEGYIRLERTTDDTGVCGMYGDMSYPTF